MPARFGMKLGKWLWKKRIIKENQIDEIRYSVEIICSEFLEISVILGYGVITRQISFTFLYLILFHILRDLFQGYHANTIWKCFTLTICAYVICMYSYTKLSEIMIPIFLISSYLLQLCYCKIHKDRKPIQISSVLISLGIVLYHLGYPNYLHMLTVVELLVSISLLPERRVYEKAMY